MDIDNTTLVLLGVFVALMLWQRMKPRSLVHPLMLGKQAEPGPVRKTGESAIYRSWATGHNTPLQLRPSGQVKTVPDMVPKDKGRPESRQLLGAELDSEGVAQTSAMLPRGLRALFPDLAKATKDAPAPIAALIPPSTTTSLPLLLLSLASRPSMPLVVVPRPAALPAALKGQGIPQAPALVVLHISEIGRLPEINCSVLLIGDPKKAAASRVGDRKNVQWWEDVWPAAEAAPEYNEEITYIDTHSYWYNESGTDVAKAMHVNMTAGVASFLAMFPAEKRPGPKDTIASSQNLNTPFGMGIALAAVLTGASIKLVGTPEPVWGASNPAADMIALAASTGPRPTILILTPAQEAAVLAGLYDTYAKTPFSSLAGRHMLRGLAAGHVSRDGLWNSLVWSNVRASVGGLAADARANIVVGPVPESLLTPAAALFALPLMRVTSSQWASGPLTATHFYDLQSPGGDIALPRPGGAVAPAGPPANNVELLLKGVAEPWPETGKAAGHVWARGPSVFEILGVTGPQGWVDTGIDGGVLPNGTFVMDA